MVRASTASLALALLAAGCDLSYNNSCFTCDGTTTCPSGLSCIGGYCQTASGHCGPTTGGGLTGASSTGGGTTGASTTTGGSTGTTNGSAICMNPPSGLCPPSTPNNSGWLSCELGCCPSTEPYSCGDTSLCYASAEQAASDCGSNGCSTCEANWCVAPADVQSCEIPTDYYCGNGGCCDPSRPWYCSDNGGTCYATQAEAMGDCQNSCTYCTPPCATSTTSNLCTGTSMLTCGNACCDPSAPYYCPTTAGGGLCFVTNAEAFQYCQTLGNACVTCLP